MHLISTEWATDIQSKSSHLHDELIHRDPPHSLAHLFKPKPTPAEVRYQIQMKATVLVLVW